MDERSIIEQMRKNQISMHRIDVLFLISGILCVIINGFLAFWDALLLPAHLGNYTKFSFFSIIESLLAIGSVPLSALSSCKKECWTAAALAAFLARVILMMIIYQGFMAGMPFLILFAVPQYLCLRKYPTLEYLKGQFGYPGFNAEIYMHRPNRRTSGEEFSARMKRAKTDPESTRMDDIKPPPTQGDYEDIFTAHRKKPL